MTWDYDVDDSRFLTIPLPFSPFVRSFHARSSFPSLVWFPLCSLEHTIVIFMPILDSGDSVYLLKVSSHLHNIMTRVRIVS